MEAREKLLQIVENARGDDLERAARVFAGCTPKQLQELWGESGVTKAALLESWQRERMEWQAAKELLVKLLDATR